MPTTPRHIDHPRLKSAVRLTPREMNDLRFSRKHTILTPDLLKTPPQTPPISTPTANQSAHQSAQ